MTFQFFSTVLCPIVITALYLIIGVGHALNSNYTYSIAYIATAFATGFFAYAILYPPNK